MKINSTKNLILWVFGFLFAVAHFKPCGVIELFNEEFVLEKDNFISAKENIQTTNNGSSLTLFGWMKLDDDSPRSHPLLKFSVLQDEGERKEVKTFSDFFILNYSNKLGEKPQVTAIVAETPYNWMKSVKNYEIPLNTWFFLAYTFDYSRGLVQVYLNNQNMGRVNETLMKIEVNFPSFYIRQFFELNIGCITTGDKKNPIAQTCMVGKARQFNYILEHFENPKYLYFLDSGGSGSKDFYFDIYSSKKKPKSIISKDDSKSVLEINGKITFGGDKTHRSIVNKGQTSFTLKNLVLDNSKYIIDSPSFYFVFKYKEPLFKKFKLLTIENFNNPTIEISLVRENSKSTKRYLKMEIKGNGVTFTTKPIFEADKIETLKLSLIQEQDLFWLMVNHEEQNSSSPKYPLKALGIANITLFNRKQHYKGEFRIDQFNVMKSAAGFFYDFFRDLPSEDCQFNCDIFGNLTNGDQRCIECNNGFVLDSLSGECVEFCPLGTKNVNEKCINCSSRNCPELTKKFFKVNQLNPNVYLVQRLKDSPDQKLYSQDIFIPEVIGASSSKDYIVQTNSFEDDPSGKTIKYQFLFSPESKMKNYKIKFTLNPKKGFYSKNRNALPTQILIFKRFSKSGKPLTERFSYKNEYVNPYDNKNRPQKIISETDLEGKEPYENFLIDLVENKVPKKVDEMQKAVEAKRKREDKQQPYEQQYANKVQDDFPRKSVSKGPYENQFIQQKQKDMEQSGYPLKKDPKQTMEEFFVDKTIQKQYKDPVNDVNQLSQSYEEYFLNQIRQRDRGKAQPSQAKPYEERFAQNAQNQPTRNQRRKPYENRVVDDIMDRDQFNQQKHELYNRIENFPPVNREYPERNFQKNGTNPKQSYEEYFMNLVRAKNQNQILSSGTSSVSHDGNNNIINPSTGEVIGSIHHSPHHNKLKEHKAHYSTNDKVNRDMAEAVYVMFILGCIAGVIGSILKLKEKFIFQKFIQTVLMMQFISFWNLYNSYIPETLTSFIGRLFELFIGEQRIYEEPLIKKYQHNFNFFFHLNIYTHDKFQEKNVYTHFLINFGLVFTFQLIFLVLFIILKIVYKLLKKKFEKSEERGEHNSNLLIAHKSIKIVLDLFSNRILQTMFLMFIIETMVFSLYNFYFSDFHHGIYKLSLTMACIYFIVVIFLLINTCCHTTSHGNIDNGSNNAILRNVPKSYLFVYDGLRLEGSSKYFQSIQYCFYFLYSLVLVLNHDHPKSQIWFTFLTFLIFFVYIAMVKPAKTNFWKIEQTVVHALILVALFFMILIISDPKRIRFEEDTTETFGDIVSYLVFIVLFWNSVVLIFKLILNFKNPCSSDEGYVDVTAIDEERGNNMALEISNKSDDQKSTDQILRQKVKNLEKEINDTIVNSKKSDDDSELLDIRESNNKLKY